MRVKFVGMKLPFFNSAILCDMQALWILSSLKKLCSVSFTLSRSLSKSL